MGDQYLPMNSWAADELPREKLLTKGVAALSVSELFAILLRSGVGGETALELARRILADNNNDLNQLARRSVRELISPEGTYWTPSLHAPRNWWKTS